jgi:hypothetical protein
MKNETEMTPNLYSTRILPILRMRARSLLMMFLRIGHDF